MIGQSRLGLYNGWLVPLADLSLILFVITSSGLAADSASSAGEQSLAQGVPSSIYLASAGGPALDAWLMQYSPGEDEQLTVLGSYADGSDRAGITAQASAVAAQAEAAGMAPRLIVQQAEQAQVIAYFAHDRDPALARLLLTEGS